MVVRFGEREIPHDELVAQAAKIADALATAGVAHGDRVAIALRNEPTFLALSDACSQMGDVSSLECVVHAAAPCPVHVKNG